MHQGVSEAEANIAVMSEEAAGLKLFTHAQGYGGSSTRLEIVGAITSIAADGPVHLATDSQAFKAKALSLHQHVQSSTTPRKPWALQPDGDMWQQYFRFAKAKRVEAIAITKVKGHATEKMVEQGLVRPQDKVGNDKADEAADEGVDLFGHEVVQLGKDYARRHRHYTKSVASLMEHLCFTYRVRAALLAQHSDHPLTPNGALTHTTVYCIRCVSTRT